MKYKYTEFCQISLTVKKTFFTGNVNEERNFFSRNMNRLLLQNVGHLCLLNELYEFYIS